MNLKLIESELNINLPSFYNSAIQSYPFTAFDDLDFVEDNLVRDAEWIIENNSKLRSSTFFGKEWPQYYFAFGHDGLGNYFFLNLKENDLAIYFADHDEDISLNDLSYLEYSSTMKEYISMSLEDQQEIIGNG
jgi:hypothetical protein